MPYDPDSYFDDSVRSGAPSSRLHDIGDWVRGEIVDQFLVPLTDFATGKVKTDRDGNELQQLVVVLQTEERNWANVARVPTVDRNDKRSPQKDPSLDDGKRAVYVPKYTNIHAAIGRAVEAGTGKVGPVRNGGTLAVKVDDLEDTGKGNPKRVFVAKYEPPAQSSKTDDFFGGQQSAPAQETPPPAQKPAGQDPWASSSQSAPAQGDPWASSSRQDEEPPF